MKAFVSLLCVATLLLFCAFLSSFTFKWGAYFEQSQRRQVIIDRDTSARTVFAEMLTTIQKDFDPAKSLIGDFIQGLPISDQIAREVIDHSGRINLNWMNRFILEKSELKATFKDGTPESLQEFRFKSGPFAQITSFKDLINENALTDLYTVWGPININTADEFMIEKVIGLRTGDEAFGSHVRDLVRNWRIQQRLVTGQDLDINLGADAKKLGDLVTAGAELNVNAASETILRALFMSGAWPIQNPAGRLAVLLDRRKQGILSKEDLQNIVGLPNTHLIYGYLGTRSSVVEIRLKQAEAVTRCVLMLKTLENGKVDPHILALGS